MRPLTNFLQMVKCPMGRAWFHVKCPPCRAELELNVQGKPGGRPTVGIDPYVNGGFQAVSPMVYEKGAVHPTMLQSWPKVLGRYQFPPPPPPKSMFGYQLHKVRNRHQITPTLIWGEGGIIATHPCLSQGSCMVREKRRTPDYSKGIEGFGRRQTVTHDGCNSLRQGSCTLTVVRETKWTVLCIFHEGTF